MPALLLLTIDSLRADYVGPGTFPNCWETFETEFVRFERALANGVATPLSVPTLLTGRHVVDDGTLPPDRPTLAELYDGPTWAASNNPHLRSDRDYDRGFDAFSDSVPDLLDDGQSATAARGDAGDEPDLTPPPNSAAEVCAVLRDAVADRRGFFWAHFIDPHYQFKPQQVRDREYSTPYSNAEILAMNERYVDGEPTAEDLAFLERFYGEQIRFLDRQLAAFFDDLRTADRWEDATIVIASDHGEAFGERGVYNHRWDADPIDSLVRVPLLVKFPGNERGGESYDHLVQNADVLPTLAEINDWEIDQPPHARPLTDLGGRTVVSKSNGAVRVTTEDGAAIRRRDGSTTGAASIDAEARTALESASIPAVEKLSGAVPGLEDSRKDAEDGDSTEEAGGGEDGGLEQGERRALERRLEDLGYR
ncbi:sulfatase-like hydrolase/transferase [Halopiger thermotolerans]